MTNKLVIIGAGGLARQVHDVVAAINDHAVKEGEKEPFEFLGFVAEADEQTHLLAPRGPLLGGDEVLSSLPNGTYYVIGIGAGLVRKKLSTKADSAGLIPATLIHPRCSIGKFGIEIGSGSIICSQVAITTDIRLGQHVFLDLSVTIGHDVILNSFVSIYPSSSISGNVVLEEGVTVGTGARVLQGLTVGADSFVGAGAVVVKDVPAHSIVVGVPGKAFQK